MHYIINLYYTSESRPDKFAFDRNRHHTYKANRRNIKFWAQYFLLFHFVAFFGAEPFRLVRFVVARFVLAGDTERRLQYLWGHRERDKNYCNDRKMNG